MKYSHSFRATCKATSDTFRKGAFFEEDKPLSDRFTKLLILAHPVKNEVGKKCQNKVKYKSGKLWEHGGAL
jgi:hypothetical protein